MRRLASIATVLLGVAGCVINPVTGERELALVSAADEVAIGDAQYVPSRQMQGGDFIVDPALTEYVRGVGERLAAVSDRALPYDFVILNSSVPNAWALPGGKVAVNRGLLTELDSEAELAAVLGHEIVHAAARHGALAMQRGLLLQTVVAATAAATGRGDYSSWAIGAAGLGAQLINQRYGREAELEADQYGMIYMSRAGYDPRAAVALQETFVRLAQGSPDQGWLSGLFASHPPSAERVERNRATAAGLPPGGELGQDRFAAATATLGRLEPAYDDYDRARRALAEGDLASAERLAAEALRVAPSEGHFHALVGDIAFARGDYAQAADHYADAIARNESYFYYHLRNGDAQQHLGLWDAAEASVQRSLELLPTAEAYLQSGRLAEHRGDRAVALERYRIAAQASGAVAEQAQLAIIRLDLPVNPGQYLTLRTALDANAMLQLEVRNPTTVTVADISVAIGYVDEQGVGRQINRLMPDVLEPNGVRRIDTRLGPFTPPRTYAVSLVSARVVTE